MCEVEEDEDDDDNEGGDDCAKEEGEEDDDVRCWEEEVRFAFAPLFFPPPVLTVGFRSGTASTSTM